MLVHSFLRQDGLAAALADFPPIAGHGSYPVGGLCCGPAFARLIAELEDAPLRRAIEEKFAIDLEGRPTMVTLRGHSDGKDGRIHTDSSTKLITLLLYLNRVWDYEAGRLRLLRRADALEDYVVEVPPVAGTMLAFRRSGHSYHGHRPHMGERRVLQLNWLTEPGVLRRELARHRWSARWKSLIRPLPSLPRRRQQRAVGVGKDAEAG